MTLSWAPSGCGPGGRAAERVEHRGRDVGEDEARTGGELPVTEPVADLGAAPVGVDTNDLRARLDGGAGGAGSVLEGGGQGAHAADRHPPLLRAVAYDVIEKAAVLHERRVVGGGERTDQGVRQNNPAHGVVPEVGLHRLAERAGHQPVPDPAADLSAKGSR